ncbi:XPG [Heterostelium album PN500]|uniref:Flap endonuclease 1 n=1 Tax=Heterostelium pallidum (strain ATCC 26659 / Pp 5 / PN500) TaxID=670386 RepID=FEN1_HETP5|nr:XPG [Heterostelium album PN500]D3BN56.1 RecName: Full=Flap endonuclease 1; Short=FEN-1; AltName: Full=Flap structure-specific endonuclease 1 [Heterostelium album PN500]EFA77418.1 XPG [Heterostelium album PN500]|eukprot:XP_020429547.1 XPG [Heterostelium album PN500]
MGIKNLTSLIEENAPSAIKSNDLKSYSGRIVAIDASTSMYQFLIAINTEMGAALMNANGETTSHLQGMFYRTIKLMTRGIKPIYVFDGKAPVLKSGELAKRYARRKEAEQQLEEANEVGNSEDVQKFQKRTISASRKQNEECKKLLELMGVPIVQAPCEAEAQCAELCKGGKAWATGSEDMDSLTLGTTILLRRLTFSEARKLPIMEIELEKVLDGLDLTHDQFVDLCILLGCDYCDTIKGIGPKKSFDMITKHKNIQTVIQNIDRTKNPIPESFPYEEVRELFKNPDVIKCQDLPEIVWKEPDVDGLIKYLVGEMGFNETRVQQGIEKLKKYKDTGVQTRIDTFFPMIKRPRDEDAGSAKKKQKTVAKPGAAGSKKKPAAKKAAGKK